MFLKQKYSMPTNTTSQVWKYISNNTAIKKLMAQGIINNRALAKKIIKELGLLATPETVVSAIRRYDNWESETETTYKKARKMLKESIFSSKSNVVCIALKKDRAIQELLPKIFSGIDFSKGEILRIVQGERAVKIIVDESNIKRISDIVPENLIIKTEKNLVELNIIFSEEAEKTPGLVSVVTNELSTNGINIEEVLTCVPELIILIDEKYFLTSTKILYGLFKDA